MTTTDNWLIERARKRKAAAPVGAVGAALTATPPIDDLWASLQQETRRQAKVFTDELGDPGALVVEIAPDTIEVRAADGRQVVLRVDRAQRTLTESFRNSAGGIRTRRPIVGFTTNAAGEAIFNFGGLQGAAGSILRRMLG